MAGLIIIPIVLAVLALGCPVAEAILRVKTIDNFVESRPLHTDRNN